MSLFAKGLFVLPAGLAAVFGGLWSVGTIGGNFREVVPGKLYRSAQLSGSNLEGAIRDYGIASVVNLRGARPGQAFYESELAVCKSAGVAHVDLNMSSRHLPPPESLIKLLHAFDRMPRPILVHCEGGADRSGLAATLYETIEDGAPLEEAQKRDLTWRYGHLAFTRAGRLDWFFDLYRKNAGGKSLRVWIEQDYAKIYQGLGDRV